MRPSRVAHLSCHPSCPDPTPIFPSVGGWTECQSQRAGADKFIPFHAFLSQDAHFIKSGCSKTDYLLTFATGQLVFHFSRPKPLLSGLFGDAKSISNICPTQSATPSGVDPAMEANPAFISNQMCYGNGVVESFSGFARKRWLARCRPVQHKIGCLVSDSLLF